METSTVKQSFISKAFNLPALKKSRLHWVDYLKGIAIILVVYRHSLLGIQQRGINVPDFLVNANMIFYSFRMPLFFLLSGIFISKSLSKRTVGQFIETKFESLMYPYFIWVIIQISLQIFLSSFTNSSRSWIDYTYIFYQPRNLDQFWYLPALFNATVVFVLIKKYITRQWFLQILIALGFYFLSPHLQKISMLSDWMEFYIFFAVGDTISEFFFRPVVQKTLKNYITLLLALPLFVFVQIFYLHHQTTPLQFLGIALVGCLTMLSLSFILQRFNILNFLRIFGYHSMYIYVMHVIIAAMTRTILVSFFHIVNPFAILFTCIIIGSVLPIIIYNVFIYNNFGWFLFTYHRNKSSKNTSSLSVLHAT